MFEGQFTLGDRKFPRIQLGTSPFIAAAQFGHRARLYQLDLYNQPENILKIIKKSYNLGVRGIQLIPYPPVVKAVRWAQDEGYKLNIIGTVRPDNITEDIKLFSQMSADVMLLHAVITDTCDWDLISENLQIIKDNDSLPGLVTHTPFRTTKKLLKSPVLDLFEIYMLPINNIGYLMDIDVFMDKERAELADLIKNLDKTIIAKKTLAAGILSPKDAFKYLKTLDYIDSVAVGIASEDEAENTFKTLLDE
ncbi:MAG: hypothetical protein LLF83_02945 [Methanobacterium sp.]|nr:hypothetical protein [Methanobacterium sp.]